MQTSDKSKQFVGTKKEPSTIKRTLFEPARSHHPDVSGAPLRNGYRQTLLNRLAHGVATMNPVATGSPQKFLRDAGHARSAAAALNGDWRRVSGDLWIGVLKSAAPSRDERDGG